jgi:hypothetical protein
VWHKEKSKSKYMRLGVMMSVSLMLPFCFAGELDDDVFTATKILDER